MARMMRQTAVHGGKESRKIRSSVFVATEQDIALRLVSSRTITGVLVQTEYEVGPRAAT